MSPIEHPKVTDLRVETSQERCCLCAQIAGEPTGDLLHELLGVDGYERRVAMESELAAVIPSVGPLVSGHVLVCPKAHHRSLAAAGAAEGEAVRTLAQAAADRLGAIYDKPVHRFEHGDAEGGYEISCSVEHAHLHLLPTEANPWPALRRELRWQLLPDRRELATAARGREYLYYETPAGDGFLHLTKDPVPSQLLRLRFAEALGNPAIWNWREAPQPQRITSTLEALRDAALREG